MNKSQKQLLRLLKLSSHLIHTSDLACRMSTYMPDDKVFAELALNPSREVEAFDARLTEEVNRRLDAPASKEAEEA